MRISVRGFALLLLAAVLAAAGTARAHGGVTESTRRMAERLEQLADASEPAINPFLNGARAAFLEKALLTEPPGSAPPILWALGQDLLNAGRTADAIVRLDQLEGMMRNMRIDPRNKDWIELRLRQAIAHLRRAEEDNCIEHHGVRSCIFPITGPGVHLEKRGARVASRLLESLLETVPGNLEARWLLNISRMTLGEYPDLVPPRWLLDPKLFEPEGDIGRFTDIAGSIGLDRDDDVAGGAIVDDFDGDGHLDVMASAMGLRSQLRYYRNMADGSFAERTDAAGLTGLTGGLNIMQTDYDNDGRLDVLVLRGAWLGPAGRFPNSLLHNEGDGTFSDVTEQAGLLSFHPTQTAVWLDFDSDGWLDLFIGNESSPGDPHPSELYHNEGNGSFTECAASAGVVTMDFVKGVASGDYDNDGRPDIYVSVKGGRNRLYHNEGASPGPAAGPPRPCRGWAFREVAAPAGVSEPIHSFPTWFWDYDNDGWEDIFVSGYSLSDFGDVAADYLGLDHGSDRPRLYRNNGDGTFADVTRPVRLHRLLLSMGANYGDLDNDGWLDFYVGTGNPDLGMLLPNRAFRNVQGRSFQDITTSAGLGHLQKGHGVAMADIDNDGDLDIFHVLGGAFEADRYRNALFENPGHGRRWISIELEGTTSNRRGVGARIKVVVRTPGGERVIHRTVRSGGSFGASPLRQHIGLGDASGIVRIEVRWPAGGSPQVINGITMDRHYLVREGKVRPVGVSLARYRLGRDRERRRPGASQLTAAPD